MQLIGTVVRLQVQRSRLKPGPVATRVYDPTPLQEVVALDVGPDGCTGTTARGERIVDVHHADHPDTRHKDGANGLSLLSLDRYAALRRRYGAHLVDGVAGELLLVDGDVPTDGELLLEDLLLTDLAPIPPCVEFTRFCLGLPPGTAGRPVREGLRALGDGARGSYATAGGPATVRVGAQLWRA